jgi:lysophospholipase L1-like esterase
MKSLGKRLVAAVAVPLALIGPARAPAHPPGKRPAPPSREETRPPSEEARQVREDARPPREEAGQVSQPTCARLRIMPLGDSITWGVGSQTRDSYRAPLARRLAAAGVRVDFVGSQRSGAEADPDNEGHPGWTIAQITAHADRWLAAYRPDVILLHIGTNDVARRNRHVPAKLAVLLDRIAADTPGTQVFVAKIIGLQLGNEKLVAGFNAAVAGIVAAKGPRFHVVDQSGVRGPDMWNRLHPNDEGYRKMARNWYAALERAMPAQMSCGGELRHSAHPRSSPRRR